MRQQFACAFAAVLMAVAAPAWAQDDIETSSSGASYSRRGQGWSLLSGKTVGAGSTALHFQFGWPGVSVGLVHGLRNNLDLGGRFTFNYGYEGITSGVIPGLKLQGLLRVNFVERGRFNFGMEVAPGPMFYFQSNGFTRVGLVIPAALQFGIAVSSAVMVNFGFELPMFVQFTPSAPLTTGANIPGLYVPILFGGGIEYFIDRNLALTFNMRMGPTIYPIGFARFTLYSLFGLGWKL
jgi:hypothetical protein